MLRKGPVVCGPLSRYGSDACDFDLLRGLQKKLTVIEASHTCVLLLLLVLLVLLLVLLVLLLVLLLVPLLVLHLVLPLLLLVLLLPLLLVLLLLLLTVSPTATCGRRRRTASPRTSRWRSAARTSRG